MKIKNKMYFLFVGLAIVGSVFGFYTSNYTLRGIMMDTIAKNSTTIAQQNIDAIDRIIYRRLEWWESYSMSNQDLIDALILSNQQFDQLADVNQYINEQDKNWISVPKEEITPFMKTLIDSKLSDGLRARTEFYNDKYRYNVFPEFFITNKYGAIVAATNKTSDYNQADEDWWLKTKQEKNYVSEISLDESAGVNSLDLCIRVDDKSGNLLGIVKVVYNVNDLFGVIKEIQNDLKTNINAYLFKNDGSLIYSISDGFGGLKKDKQDVWQSANSIQLDNGVKRLFSHASSKGYMDFKSLGWIMFVGQDTNIVLAPLTQLIYSNLISVFLVVIILLFLGLFTSNLIFRPLKNLAEAISLIKEGKKNIRVDIKSNDEIGMLSQSFNDLVEKLENEQVDVEKKVAEQTLEIKKNINNLNEQKTAVINILDDVERERKNVEELHIRDEAILGSIGDGVIITDPVGNILLVNSAALVLLQLNNIDPIGKKIFFLIEMRKEDGTVIPIEERPVNKVINNKKPIIDQMYYYVRNDKTVFPASVTVTPVFLDEKIIGTVEVFRDVTRERDIDKAKTEFVSLASHQLRTPLSSINWYAEMLLNGDAGRMTAEQSQYVQEIYRGNQRMVDLVNSLLNVSRLELGTFSVEPEDCDLVDIFKDVLDDLLPKMVNKKIKLEQKFDKITKMQLDKKLTHIILENLLSNAVKYTPSGGKVSFNVTKKADNILITVEDNGMGIPESQQKKIFEKLFRADNVRATDTEGTGLGLYLVKSILEHIGGTIRFQSIENKGTKFFVTLPIVGMKKKEGTKSLS